MEDEKCPICEQNKNSSKCKHDKVFFEKCTETWNRGQEDWWKKELEKIRTSPHRFYNKDFLKKEPTK